MKIVYTEVTKKEEDIDIQFPIYKKYFLDFGGFDGEGDKVVDTTTIWTRVEDIGGTLCETSVEYHEGSRNSYNIFLDENYQMGHERGTRDEILGLGKYACSQAEFDEALMSAIQFIKDLF